MQIGYCMGRELLAYKYHIWAVSISSLQVSLLLVVGRFFVVGSLVLAADSSARGCNLPGRSTDEDC